MIFLSKPSGIRCINARLNRLGIISLRESAIVCTCTRAPGEITFKNYTWAPFRTSWIQHDSSNLTSKRKSDRDFNRDRLHFLGEDANDLIDCKNSTKWKINYKGSWIEILTRCRFISIFSNFSVFDYNYSFIIIKNCLYSFFIYMQYILY